MSESPSPLPRRQFASDNYAGICPEAWAAMAAANHGHACSYGEDEWTQAACDLIRRTFECDCEVFFVFNGTAANSLSLAALCQSYHSIICHQTAHIETDECGAPEFFSNGTKILLAPGENGRLDADSVAELVHRRTDIHYPKPRVLSLTEATELGTVYDLAALARLRQVAGACGLRLHIDGARLANALVSLDVSPAEFVRQAHPDVLCLGGVKGGLAVGEAVVFLNRELAQEFEYRCKQAGQLASKARFLAAPWLGVLRDGTWLRHAAHANACARQLAAGLGRIPGVRVMFPCQANSVFAQFPPGVSSALRARGWRFYSFIGVGGARLMCSWDTQQEDVDALVADVAASCAVPA
jgi:threonine aldolase